MFRVIALDPGVTTGWATYTARRMEAPGRGGSYKYEYYDEQFSCGQIGPQEHHLALWDLLGLQQTQDYFIVCESFEFRQMDNKRDNVELVSREYIGITKLFVAERGGNLRMQTAAKAKGFLPDKGSHANVKLRQAGLWYPNQKHAMDAMRHLLFSLVHHHARLDLVERWWRPRNN